MHEQKITFIYGLYSTECPEIIRYVGKSDFPEKRIYEHLWSAQKAAAPMRNWPIYKWIRKALCAGYMVEARIIEQVVYMDWDTWGDRERYWINFYKALTPQRLLNVADGGRGGMRTEEHRVRHKEGVKRIVNTPEWKEKQLAGIRKVSATPEWKKNQKESVQKANKSPIVRENKRQAALANKDAFLVRVQKANAGVPKSEQQKEKLRQVNLGKTHTVVSKKKNSDASQRNWADPIYRERVAAGKEAARQKRMQSADQS